ncbi:hypothetical protein RHMOL_Rhmol08G0120400 [Rhododendron molle]|uniref:Uncharacterized protein n=1 Tax=Rhododendron molle TaxID=49168 RepID=A0ACC0MNP7_RHOML|nr:hypothetical protein RHMOL_Rhmol08G0120400 [Rhododendron molle]
MHWWQSPFSFPSSTSSSSKHHQHSHDNVLTKLFPRRAFRSQRRGRSTKLRYRSADDTAPDDHRHNTLWRSPSASTSQPHSSSFSSSPSRPSPVVPPQPLPLPVLEELLRRDAAAASPSTSWSPADVPLPSPKQRPNRGQEDGDRERGDDGATPASNNACHECQRHKEHANTQRSVKAPQELNGIERQRDPYLFNIPNSAPSSPFSSPSRSPQRIPRDIFTSPVFKSPKVFQAWSAPEMRPLDTHAGSVFSYQMSLEGKSAFSVESSPLHSPRVSPQRCPRSPSGPTSPTAHRLPLPPGATSPTKIPPVSPIVMPIKSQWQKGKLIGRGTFGSVYVASNRETGALCAMKEVELFFDDPKSAECIKQLEQEIKVLSNLKHPNIVQYYGSEVDGDRLYIYLEYVHPGSINKYILDHCGVMSESVVRSFTRHILCGLAYLHSTRTIHRDIKCANLLVDLAGPAANLSLKGSPYWMAPELLQSVMQKDASSDLALAVDIWSLGCTIIEMLNGKPPWSEYEGAAAMFKVLRETPPIPEILSPEGKDFLRCCFHRNPADRPSAVKLLDHRFLSTSQIDVQPCTQGFNEMILMVKFD